MIIEKFNTIQLEYYTEGPAMDNEGNLYCTTLTGRSILKIDKNKKYSVWSSTICPNGQIILPNGDHLVCDSVLSSIVRFNKDGVFQKNEINKSCKGIKVLVPNDLTTDREGGIYFTDSIRKEGKICYRSVIGRESIIATGLDYPNGLALSLDEKTLFVAESYENRIIAFNLESPGVSNGKVNIIAQLPGNLSGKRTANLPDGIALDNKEHLWVAHYGMQAVQVISLSGESIQSIDMPFPLVSNVFFSKTNNKEVIVTGGYNEPGPGAVCILTVKI